MIQIILTILNRKDSSKRSLQYFFKDRNLKTFYNDQLLESYLFRIFIKSFEENARVDHE